MVEHILPSIYHQGCVKYPISELGPSHIEVFAERDPSLTGTGSFSTQTGRRAGQPSLTGMIRYSVILSSGTRLYKAGSSEQSEYKKSAERALTIQNIVCTFMVS
jgi:hypothetical protein